MTLARTPSLTVLLAGLLASVACGSPRASSVALDPGDDSTSASGESPETETGDDPTSTTAGPFVPEDDTLATNACDTWAQDCPEGEKCVAYSSTGGNWDSTKCVPVTGDQGPGEPCVYGGDVEATDDCRADSMCWDVMDVDGQLIGECVPFCGGAIDGPICPEFYNCSISSQGSLNLCIPSCDPILQDCDEGLGCYWDGGKFLCIFATQDIPLGQPCGFINDCVAGSICLASELLPACAGPSCCAPFCALGLGDGPCEAIPGSTCNPLFEPDQGPPEYADVGVCRLP
jgi:hypothetical protein